MPLCAAKDKHSFGFHSSCQLGLRGKRHFDIFEVKLILITGWLGRTFGVPWFWWKKKISRSCFIWKCFLYQNGCFFESLLLWWVDSEPNKLMRQINVWGNKSWLVQYDFKNLQNVEIWFDAKLSNTTPR